MSNAVGIQLDKIPIDNTRINRDTVNKMMTYAAAITTKFINTFSTQDVMQKTLIVLEIPDINHKLSKLLACMYKEISELKHDMVNLRDASKTNFYNDKANKFKPEKDFKIYLENTKEFNYIDYMISYLQISVKTIEKYQNDIVELRIAVNAYSNMRNTNL